MKYKIIYPWHDIETNIVHPVGDIVEMDNKARANKLVELGAFEEIKEEKPEKIPVKMKNRKKNLKIPQKRKNN